MLSRYAPQPYGRRYGKHLRIVSTEAVTERTDRRGRSPASLANLRRLPKGISGNPAGYPRALRAPRERLSRLARKHTKEALQVLLHLARHATNEETRRRAALALIHEAYGTPPTTQEVIRPDAPLVNIDLRNLPSIERMSQQERLEFLQTLRPVE